MTKNKFGLTIIIDTRYATAHVRRTDTHKRSVAVAHIEVWVSANVLKRRLTGVAIGRPKRHVVWVCLHVTAHWWRLFMESGDGPYLVASRTSNHIRKDNIWLWKTEYSTFAPLLYCLMVSICGAKSLVQWSGHCQHHAREHVALCLPT